MPSSQSHSASAAHWVFGYGSLIWNPGFPFLRAEQAMLDGAHRSLSIYSHHHRGTVAQPGLVFGLVHGGSCRGMAFEVADTDWADVHFYLREREQVTSVYREAFRSVHLASGQIAQALTYLVDEGHVQYAGKLSLETQLAVVLKGVGQSGRNIDYVLNTARHLETLGIRDDELIALSKLLEAA